jgi:IclR family acetate operon transcriptional repressor
MRNGTPKVAAFRRTLAMLDAVLADGGQSGIAAIARGIGMPVATAHRQVATLLEEGYLARDAARRHIAGPRLIGMLHRLDEKQIVAACAAPVLHRLAAESGTVVQLGTFENDMVTYRVKTGQGAGALFSRVGMQLEAYCSGIGKVLLANLPDDHRRAYLATGPFPALTARTITDPGAIADELERVRAQGFAFDAQEVADGLICAAVPVRWPDGRVLAAISSSQFGEQVRPPEELLPALRAAASEIERTAFGG